MNRGSVTARIRSLRQGRWRMEVLLIIGFVALWLALQLYILPKLGIAT